MTALNGKVVLITGASSGIGEGTARVLAGAGARAVLGARRADRLRTLAGEIEARGGQVRTCVLDVTDLGDSFRGSDRRRFVVAAKGAFATAGATAGSRAR